MFWGRRCEPYRCVSEILNLSLLSSLSHRQRITKALIARHVCCMIVVALINKDSTACFRTYNAIQHLLWRILLHVLIKNQIINTDSEWSDENKTIIIQALTAIDFNSGFNHSLTNSRDASQFTRQMDAWFDGFKTLKYLHALRDKNNLNNLSEQRYLNLLSKINSDDSHANTASTS